MTGGRVYSYALKCVFPDFEKTAPLERRVVHERLSLLDSSACATMDFRSDAFSVEGQDSYTVLRGPFDQWLACQAEAAGVNCINGIAVERLVKDDDGNVVGISAGGDEITAHVTIVADGANSLLASQATGAKCPRTTEMAVGIKEVLALPRKEIDSRFSLSDDDGAAWLFVGECTKGLPGGGFLYTNKESISLGLVVPIHGLESADTTICQMMEDFKNHPDIASVIKGSCLVEHSGHMVPEGGFNAIPEVHGNGVLLVGDAAMLCMNLGYMVRGMDLALISGKLAGEAASKAIEGGDVSKAALGSYEKALRASSSLQDMRAFKDWPAMMGGFSNMFQAYPSMIAGICNELFVVDGSPQVSIKQNVMGNIKQSVGVVSLLKDIRGVVKSL